MSGWLKQQMVPVFLGDDNIPIAHGQLKRVWLGGLVNPQALFTAILHEAALGCDCLDDQVSSLHTCYGKLPFSFLQLWHLHLITILNNLSQMYYSICIRESLCGENNCFYLL